MHRLPDFPPFHNWLSIPESRPKLVIAVRILTTVSLIAVFLCNAIPNAIPFTELGNIGDISDRFNVPFTPAGYAFSIWGLIYLCLAMTAVYVVLPRTFGDRVINEGFSFWWIPNAIFNISWIFSWLSQPATSPTWGPLVCMYGILVVLIIQYMRMRPFTPASSWLTYVTLNLGLSIYFAWILGASTINTFVTFGGYYRIPPADPLTEDQITLIQDLSVAALVTLLLIVNSITVLRKDPVIGYVFTWTSIAIAIQKWNDPPRIAVTALVNASLTGLVSLAINAWNIRGIYNGTRLGWDHKQVGELQKPDSQEAS